MKVGFAFSLFSASTEIGRQIPLKKLAFRGRSGSLLGAFAPAGLPSFPAGVSNPQSTGMVF